ncbi:MAG: 50S ribosomal protein L11 [Candidatus Micrarchaeota archaeon]|nr:MAG: 50S ribosomal protein L11 [Candidatus Micrarchaeota archaeon]
MAEVEIKALVKGGKATAGPPLGPALGATGVNIGQVIAEINKQTSKYNGLRVPVKIIINSETKQFKVEVRKPFTSIMLLSELGIEKGKKANETVGDISLDKLVNIAKEKSDVLLGKDLKSKVKEVLGTCKSAGITCDGMDPKEVIKKINSGEIKIE